uniref:Uncharacterized protein n=1 Tax=Mycena chlorophos TaxID=658473 RepID=A0ABQ0LRF4_MYCCL|nr:predicted protein [Mycena chlorophos]
MAAPPNDHVLVLQPAVSALVHACQQPDNDSRTLLASLRAVIDASGPDAKARSIELVGVEGCAMLVEKLPWELVVLFYCKMTRPISVQQLFRLLRELRVDEDWVREQERLALQSLAAVQAEDIPRLLQLLEASGEEGFVQSILPQLASKNPSQYFWRVSAWKPLTNDTDKLLHIFMKMRHAARTRSAPEATSQYYYPLAEYIMGLGQEPSLSDSKLPRESLQYFLLDVLDSLLVEEPVGPCFTVTGGFIHRWREGHPTGGSSRWAPVESRKSDACPFNDENIAKILRVAAALGGVHFLQYSPGLSVDALKKHDRSVVKDFARAVARDTKPEHVDDPAYAAYDSVVSALLGVHPPAESDPDPALMDFFQLALQLGAHTAFKDSQLLRPYRPSPLDEAFKAFARFVLTSFADELYRFRTDTFSILDKFHCEARNECRHGCPGLREWLIAGRPEIHREMRKKDSRKHLEEKLEELSRAGIPLTWTTADYSSPHTLVITKTKHDTWRLYDAIPRANRFLSAVGNVEEQKRVFDGDYEFVREEVDMARWPGMQDTTPESRKRRASTQLVAPVLQRARNASSSGSSDSDSSSSTSDSSSSTSDSDSDSYSDSDSSDSE